MTTDSELLSFVSRWQSGDFTDDEIERQFCQWANLKSIPKDREQARTELLVANDQLTFGEFLRELVKLADARLTAILTNAVCDLQPSNSSSRPSIWSRCGQHLSEDTFGNGRYSFFEPPVVSGEGEIWKAIDNSSRLPASRETVNGASTQLHRLVALKRPRRDLLTDFGAEAVEERLLREGVRASLLEHPNICPVYDVFHGSDTQPPFYAMRFLGGDTFAETVRTFHQERSDRTPDKSDWARLIRILVDACSGVAHAHAKGLVHLDLKPTNIMIGDQGETQVIDWGMSSRLSERGFALAESIEPTDPIDARYSSYCTRPTGTISGTPAYCAPEQTLGRPCGVFTDVFQLGAILHEILTGIAPFYASTAKLSIIRSALSAKDDLQDRQKFSHLRRHQLRDLVAVAKKAMEPSPEKRYSSVQLFQAELEAWLADEPVTARRSSVLEKSARHTRRNFAATVIGCLTIAMIPLLITAPFAYRWLGYERERVVYYRLFTDSIYGPIGVLPMSNAEVSHCYSAIEATHQGWFGPIVRVRAVDRTRNTHWEHGFRSITEPEWIETSPQNTGTAVEITYTYRDGVLHTETAEDEHGFPVWQINYEPLDGAFWWAETRYKNQRMRDLSLDRISARPRDGIFKRSGVNSLKLEVDSRGRFKTIAFRENSDVKERKDGVFGLACVFDDQSNRIVKAEYFYDPNLNPDDDRNKVPGEVRYVELSSVNQGSYKESFHIFDFEGKPAAASDGIASWEFMELAKGWRLSYRSVDGKNLKSEQLASTVDAEFLSPQKTKIRYLDSEGDPFYGDDEFATIKHIHHGRSVVEYSGYPESAELSRVVEKRLRALQEEHYHYRDSRKDQEVISQYKSGLISQVEYRRHGKFFYDAENNLARTTYKNYDDTRPLLETHEALDANGKLVVAHTINRQHDGRIATHTKLLNWHRDEPIVSSETLFYESQYDVEEDNEYERERAYFVSMDDRQPCLGPENWHRFERTWFEDTGKVREERFFGTQDDLLWSYRFSYDEESADPPELYLREKLGPDDRAQRYEYLIDNELAMSSRGYARAEIEYISSESPDQSQTEIWRLYDTVGKPCRHRDGHDWLEKSFKEKILVSILFHDVSDSSTESSFTLELYNPNGTIDRIQYLDESRRRIRAPNSSVFEIKYSYEPGTTRLLRTEYFDEHGAVIEPPNAEVPAEEQR